MFFPSPRTSNAGLQNAIFDYLNLNRHKFDEFGDFDTTPDERDHLDPILVGYRAGPPKTTPPWGDLTIDPQTATELRNREFLTWSEDDDERVKRHKDMEKKGN